MKPLDLICRVEEIQGMEAQVKGHHRETDKFRGCVALKANLSRLS